METTIRTFEPIAGTVTHVLLDSWYSAKRLWRAAREREFLIHHGDQVQSVAGGSRPHRTQRLEVATTVGVYCSVARERLRRVGMAEGKEDGLRACRNDTGA